MKPTKNCTNETYQKLYKWNLPKTVQMKPTKCIDNGLYTGFTWKLKLDTIEIALDVKEKRSGLATPYIY